MIIDQDLDRHRGEQRDRSRDSEHGMFLFISNSSKFVNLNGSLFGISSICLYLYVMYVIYVIYVTIPSYIYKVNIYTHIYIHSFAGERGLQREHCFHWNRSSDFINPKEKIE